MSKEAAICAISCEGKGKVKIAREVGVGHAIQPLQFRNVAASLNGREHQPSKLRVAGLSPAAVPLQKRNAQEPAG
jgi:hypothetical protein